VGIRDVICRTSSTIVIPVAESRVKSNVSVDISAGPSTPISKSSTCRLVKWRLNA